MKSYCIKIKSRKFFVKYEQLQKIKYSVRVFWKEMYKFVPRDTKNLT